MYSITALNCQYSFFTKNVFNGGYKLALIMVVVFIGGSI